MGLGASTIRAADCMFRDGGSFGATGALDCRAIAATVNEVADVHAFIVNTATRHTACGTVDGMPAEVVRPSNFVHPRSARLPGSKTRARLRLRRPHSNAPLPQSRNSRPVRFLHWFTSFPIQSCAGLPSSPQYWQSDDSTCLSPPHASVHQNFPHSPGMHRQSTCLDARLCACERPQLEYSPLD
ncbi:hypothetical protein Poly24_28320 [Rosistilla carotiformis]|uniref:Uncharacterized protein n=1 Tax=Rosistilla carotiformis TaxID=2528017 RepID=A0A518JU97_9BACT|nr:hypothetical protein Poly24_28320 [Rosistilla carotiformis]